MLAQYRAGMTITEQLQFSVLTAPVAMLDRRTLSQAWYSALYGSTQAKPAMPECGASTHARQTSAAPGAYIPRNRKCIGTAQRAATGAKTGERAEGGDLERRAPRSRLARKIERELLRPRSGENKTAFTVDGEHGRVHVVLQTRGSQLKLVAICPPKARAAVAAALAQARYALALRGIDLNAEMRGAAC
jgi:hypothetical protein